MSVIPFTGRTRVSVLIGSPIAQVLAPGRMTAMMQTEGFDGILVPLEVPVAQFDQVLPALQALPNVDAILVTLPHKGRAAERCGTLSDMARRLGAVNALRRSGDGWHGDNFDGAGMVAAIRARGVVLDGARIHMAGAGAAGTAIAVALLSAGARTLTFHDLDPGAEARLASLLEQHFPGRARAASAAEAGAAEIVINASCCGLKPDDPLPVPAAALRHAACLADVITDPLETPFLRAAPEGAVRVTGGDMLDGQLRLLFDFIKGARR